MPGRKGTDEILSDAAKVQTVWRDNPSFTLGEITPTALQAQMTDAQTADAAVADARTRLTALIDQRDAAVKTLSQTVTRARSGFRAVFGPDSAQYEQSGGTRASERKPPTRAPQKPN